MTSPRILLEATRTATVNYPVPFLVSVCALSAILCFVLGRETEGNARWLVFGSGFLCMGTALFVACWAVVRGPELLRSERHASTMRMLDLLSDSDLDPAIQQRVGRILSATIGPLSRNQKGTRPQTDVGDSSENADG